MSVSGKFVDYTGEGGRNTVIAIEHKSGTKASEQAIDYDFNLNEITLADEYPDYDPNDSVVVCVYPEQAEDFVDIDSDTQELSQDQVEKIKDAIDRNKTKPYHFHYSRLF